MLCCLIVALKQNRSIVDNVGKLLLQELSNVLFETMEPPLQLEIVTLVLTKLCNNALTTNSIGAIISDFLVSDISLSKAIEWSHAGSLALLDLVWTRSLRPLESSRWSAANLLHTRDY